MVEKDGRNKEKGHSCINVEIKLNKKEENKKKKYQ